MDPENTSKQLKAFALIALRTAIRVRGPMLLTAQPVLLGDFSQALDVISVKAQIILYLQRMESARRFAEKDSG